MTAMRPVVNDPNISFTQLARELTEAPTEEALSLVRDQFLAKLQRKKRHLTESAARDFETCAGMTPDAFIANLRGMPIADIVAWFTQNPGLGEILDRKSDGPATPIFISHHEDNLREVKQGFGDKDKPEDYIEAFKDFINTKGNQIPALVTVVTRPQELTRKQLRELQYELDQAGYSETTLNSAWRQMKNEEMAATIIGYIRQAAIGDPLVPFDQRVDTALKSMLASKNWTQPQREWLKKLAAQTKANRLVDRAALDDPNLLFKREGGGFARLDRIFDGHLDQVLNHFNDSLWREAK
jgi:type I restriction enzyme R subunit